MHKLMFLLRSPCAGLPIPRNVRVDETSNASITLTWDYPPPPVHTITGFKVTHTHRFLASLLGHCSGMGAFIYMLTGEPANRHPLLKDTYDRKNIFHGLDWNKSIT